LLALEQQLLEIKRKLGSLASDQGGSSACPCSSDVGFSDPTGWRRSKAAEAGTIKTATNEHQRPWTNGSTNDHGHDPTAINQRIPATLQKDPRRTPVPDHRRSKASRRVVSLQQRPLWLCAISRIFSTINCRPGVFARAKGILWFKESERPPCGSTWP